MDAIKICKTSDVKEGDVRRFLVGDLDVAVYNIGGCFYVTDDTCTHGPASLSDGFVEGETVECPFHYGVFHVPTGKPLKSPCVKPITTYVVKVSDDCVFVIL
ncbi:non-heme iron oxygenase ferredoxin subunit (plasmid) [Sphingobium sp. SJ10-10]|uniref:non-heme iron oxygenase ferredoxin subunit n=1 Tax=Sphingobium sp. SJ10-10 TaxID=3114999 RepID=UPI002E18016B|nr:non-heme iron oxygenase ferredoxin subunit [Sphingobium sp. SJ10-10]